MPVCTGAWGRGGACASVAQQAASMAAQHPANRSNFVPAKLDLGIVCTLMGGSGYR